MKRLKQAAVIFMLLGFGTAGAQEVQSPETNITKLEVKQQTAQPGLIISFRASDTPESLMVRVTDKNGETLFLDNRAAFSGNYSQAVYLGTMARGTYTVNISRDKGETTKNVEVK